MIEENAPTPVRSTALLRVNLQLAHVHLVNALAVLILNPDMGGYGVRRRIEEMADRLEGVKDYLESKSFETVKKKIASARKERGKVRTAKKKRK